MLDAHSPLEGVASFESHGISITEAGGFKLCQYAGDEKILKKSLGRLPAKVGVAITHEGHTLFRIAPRQVWVLGEDIPPVAGLHKTPLSSGRCRLQLSGPNARGLLMTCCAIDFHRNVFKPGQFAMTGIHHTPVTIHCISDEAFHVYVLRTFAQAVWEWLSDAAAGMGD
jgi:methylglutamate dehydrogenase subunit D